MPKVMYINATGTNPTGIIIPLERRKEIYRIACEYNFLILDDDPYHFVYFDKVSHEFFMCDKRVCYLTWRACEEIKPVA